MSQIELVPPVSVVEDRRQRRQRETLTEILTVSLVVMREEGVGGLSLAEVARRMGMKPPSLYKHIDSKMAVYDALFTAGARAHDAALEEAIAGRTLDIATLEVGFQASIRWAVGHPTLTQLLFWRPVPGFEPSPGAFAASVAAMDRVSATVAAVVERGELHPDAASEAGIALLTCLASGVITQQLANEPAAPFEAGRFTRHTSEAFALFAARYGRTP